MTGNGLLGSEFFARSSNWSCLFGSVFWGLSSWLYFLGSLLFSSVSIRTNFFLVFLLLDFNPSGEIQITVLRPEKHRSYFQRFRYVFFSVFVFIILIGFIFCSKTKVCSKTRQKDNHKTRQLQDKIKAVQDNHKTRQPQKQQKTRQPQNKTNHTT
jgi:hypothetical protein